jgi:hypothetical protein
MWMLVLRDMLADAGIRSRALEAPENNFGGSPTPDADGLFEGCTNTGLLFWRDWDRSNFTKQQLQDLPCFVSALLHEHDDWRIAKSLQRFAQNYSGRRPFRVESPGWNSDCRFYKVPCELFLAFSKWCSTRHALAGCLEWAHAAEGGFGGYWCPGADLYDLTRLHETDCRIDIRGSHEYRGRHRTPFWNMIVLREALETFGLVTQTIEDNEGFWRH